MSADCNTRYCYINPEMGSAAAVMEAGRNVAMTGSRPLAITDCLNFGNPENPEVMWQFKYSCEGIKKACKELNTPVIGGNVSYIMKQMELEYIQLQVLQLLVLMMI